MNAMHLPELDTITSDLIGLLTATENGASGVCNLDGVPQLLEACGLEPVNGIQFPFQRIHKIGGGGELGGPQRPPDAVHRLTIEAAGPVVVDEVEVVGHIWQYAIEHP